MQGQIVRAPPAPSPAYRGRRATLAEMLVVRDALAQPLTIQREFVRRSGLPRRTYQWTLRQVGLRRWLLQRYLPSPSLTGRPFATFVVATPHPGQRDRVVRSVIRNPAAVLCWAMPETVLGVVFTAHPSTPAALFARWRQAGVCDRIATVCADCSDRGVPIYFDFEGEWSRYGGLGGLIGYPHDLRERRRRGASGDAGAPPSESVRNAVREMTARVERNGTLPSGGPGPFARLGRGAVEQSLLRSGWVEARSFLEPNRLRPTLTDFASAIVLLAGRLRAGRDPMRLARELVESAQVRPFLLVSDGLEVLVGFLAAGPATRLAPGPVVHASARSVLEGALERFEVTRSPLSGLLPVVSHRYAPLIATGASGPGPR